MDSKKKRRRQHRKQQQQHRGKQLNPKLGTPASNVRKITSSAGTIIYVGQQHGGKQRKPGTPG